MVTNEWYQLAIINSRYAVTLRFSEQVHDVLISLKTYVDTSDTVAVQTLQVSQHPLLAIAIRQFRWSRIQSTIVQQVLGDATLAKLLPRMQIQSFY